MADGMVNKATAAITAANLAAIEHKILLNFVKEAEDPDLAAQEVLDRICGESRSVEESLRKLKKDWYDLVVRISCPDPVDSSLRDLVGRRDQFKCRVSPPGSQQVDAPEAAFILPPSLSTFEGDGGDKSPSKSLLDVFMTAPRAARLCRMLSETSDQGRLSNTWLLTSSVLHAFRRGHLEAVRYSDKSWKTLDEEAVLDDLESNTTKSNPQASFRQSQYCLMPTYPDIYKNVFLADRSSFYDGGHHGIVSLDTDDPKQLPLPSPFILKSHSKFATALHQFYIEKRIAEGWGPLESPSYFSRSVQLFFRAIWHLVPKFVRVACYQSLYKIGISKYGYTTSPLVQQLPFGLYAKHQQRYTGNEPHALRLIEKYAPSIPAPLIIDTFRISDKDWFIMTSLPGTPLELVIHRTSYAEREQIAADLSHVLSQMHTIRNTTPYRFTSSLGGPIHDWRIGCENNGPFNTEEALNARMTDNDPRIQTHLANEVPMAFLKSHVSVFTHGDLYFSNVLVDGGKLSGIIDWEQASFMPEYWDFTKAMRTARTNEAREIYRKVWGDKFELELETEMCLWQSFPFGG